MDEEHWLNGWIEQRNSHVWCVVCVQVDAVVASTSSLVQSMFPHVEPTPFETQSCLYTSTPDHDYVLGHLPSSRRIVLAGGGSGHAFKMGPAIGDFCAALALAEEPPLGGRPLSRFEVGRFGEQAQYEGNSAKRR